MLLLLTLAILPSPLVAQALGPTAGLGYGITQSQFRSGEAMNAQAGLPLATFGNIQLRGEFLYQWGTTTGRSCETVAVLHCIGSTDRNQILGAGAALHFPLGSVGPVTLFVPVGAGVYHRRTTTTESEGPIAICIEDSVFVQCSGNPPFGSKQHDSKSTAPGFNAGVGFTTKIAGVGMYAEVRSHGVLERDSRAGALPLTVGFRF
jgi:hypothetical protein